MKRINLYLLIVAMALSACNSSTKENKPSVTLSPDTLAVGEAEMQQFIDNGSYAGILVRTVTLDETLHNAAFGYADIEKQIPINENQIFRMFSMTKPVVAAGLMTLYDEGKFTLDDPVADYIPAFADTKVYTENETGFTLEEQTSPITIRHLLTHTSGMTYGWNPEHYVDSIYMATAIALMVDPLEIFVEKLADIPLKFQPGTKYEYSVAIDVAGYLIEVISGQPLDEFLEERIFDPLKMDDSGFQVHEKDYERYTTLYSRDSEGKLLVMTAEGPADFNKRFKEPPVNISGGAGLQSTIGDYERFCKMLLNSGELDGKRILEKETVAMIMSDQLPAGTPYVEGKIGYGLGGSVNLETGQYGWSGAASTAFTIYPQTGIICLGLAQLYPSDHKFSNVYRDFVKRAVVGEEE